MKCFKAKAVVPDAVVELDASYFLSVDIECHHRYEKLSQWPSSVHTCHAHCKATTPFSFELHFLAHAWHILKDCLTYQNNDMKLRVLLFASVFQVKLSSEARCMLGYIAGICRSRYQSHLNARRNNNTYTVLNHE